MTRQEAYDKIIECMKLPKNTLKYEDYNNNKLNVIDRKMDLGWHLHRMENMLIALREQGLNPNNKKLYEDTFDASYRDVLKLLDTQGWR